MRVSATRVGMRLAPALAVIALSVLSPGVALAAKSRTTSTKDTTPPTVSISAPSNGATLTGSFTVTGTASDNVSVASVQVAVDGGALQTATGTTSWSYG